MADGGTDWLCEKWTRWMRSAGRSRRTIDDRVRLVRQFEDQSGVSSLVASWEDLADFLGAEHFEPGTRQTYHTHLRQWFRWLALMDYRLDDPTIKLPTPKAVKRYPHPVSLAQLTRLLSTPHYHRTHAMLLLGAYEGFRVSEIARTRGEDFGEELRVRGKGGRVDYLPIHPLVAEVAATMPARGLWFPSPVNAGQPVAGKSVSATISKLMERADLPAVPHALRHFFGTECLRVYGDLATVQQMMRHENVATTVGYTKVDRQKMHDTMAALPVPLHLVRDRRHP